MVIAVSWLFAYVIAVSLQGWRELSMNEPRYVSHFLDINRCKITHIYALRAQVRARYTLLWNYKFDKTIM